MRRIRIIPRLDVKGPNLVKGIHLEGLRVLGPPEYFAERYYREGADELLYMDVVASLYGRNNLRAIVERTARHVFIPITVGGGIRSLEDIRAILRAGADKVAINTAAIQRPQLITEGAQAFGSQCMVTSIEAKRMPTGRYEAFTDNGRQETGVDVIEWARHAANLGAGEILITSVDREGTGQGYDVDLVAQVSEAVPIPVIACGGAGRPEHFVDVIKHTGVEAVCAASVLHYRELNQELVRHRFEEGNIEFLKRFVQQHDGGRLKRFQPLSIGELKSHVGRLDGVHVRSVQVEGAPRTNVAAEPADGGPSPTVVVVDYGCGNLFSVEHALQQIGVAFDVSSDPRRIASATHLILPGVGAFGDGMRQLKERRLDEAIRVHVAAGKPLLGICLGMQLLMGSSEEFGWHEGLGIIPGKVIRLHSSAEGPGRVRIPHIGWSAITRPRRGLAGAQEGLPTEWRDTILEGVPLGSFMYFVHSFMVVPESATHVLAATAYGPNVFCSAIRDGQVYGCQFHPERSGEIGLSIYRRFVQVGTGGTHELGRGQRVAQHR